MEFANASANHGVLYLAIASIDHGVWTLFKGQPIPREFQSTYAELNSYRQILQQVNSLLTDYPSLNQVTAQTAGPDFGYIISSSVTDICKLMEQVVKVGAREMALPEVKKKLELPADLDNAISKLRRACDHLVSLITLLVQPHHPGNVSRVLAGVVIDIKKTIHEVAPEQLALYAVDDTVKLRTLSCGPPNVEAMRVAGGSTVAATHGNAQGDNDRSGSQPWHGVDVECSAQSAALWIQNRVSMTSLVRNIHEVDEADDATRLRTGLTI
ncbi:hypothetical protein LTS10_004391 [Elasticomyces elasticus]|nr:hypothetical protein LTS10_004391 [Elasticomyces elasticus]